MLGQQFQKDLWKEPAQYFTFIANTSVGNIKVWSQSGLYLAYILEKDPESQGQVHIVYVSGD
jgi:hypothetical protein